MAQSQTVRLGGKRFPVTGGRAGFLAQCESLLCGLLLCGSLLCLQSLAAWAGEEAPAGDDPGRVVVIEIDSIIHGVAEEFLEQGLARAHETEARALVVLLNTPGGHLDATRRMVTATIESTVPVVVFVAPSGAQAASAGFILLMAADVAAMTPGSNTGAAHPVGGQGENIEGAMGKKVEEDTAALVRSLAERSGRDLKLAESAVVESRSFTAAVAKAGGVFDLVAPNLQALLRDLEGVSFSRGGESLRLELARAAVERLELTRFQRARSVLAHPNIAYLLLTLGGLGLYFEFANPGAIFPGVVGALCTILGLYSMSVLPINYAGVALLVLAAVLFLLEIKVQSFGLLTVGGVASLIAGSMLLFRDVEPALRVSTSLVLTMAAASAAVVGFLTTLAVRAQRGRVRTGGEAMVNEVGVARSDLAPAGKVSLRVEIWHAVADQPIRAGERVVVTSVDGMTLHVTAERAAGVLAGSEEG